MRTGGVSNQSGDKLLTMVRMMMRTLRKTSIPIVLMRFSWRENNCINSRVEPLIQSHHRRAHRGQQNHHPPDPFGWIFNEGIACRTRVGAMLADGHLGKVF